MYTIVVKNITFSADEADIEAARKRAQAERTTLNEVFRRWLQDYACRERQVEDVMAFLERVAQYASSGGRQFTRDEMNER